MIHKVNPPRIKHFTQKLRLLRHLTPAGINSLGFFEGDKEFGHISVL